MSPREDATPLRTQGTGTEHLLIHSVDLEGTMPLGTADGFARDQTEPPMLWRISNQEDP